MSLVFVWALMVLFAFLVAYVSLVMAQHSYKRSAKKWLWPVAKPGHQRFGFDAISFFAEKSWVESIEMGRLIEFSKEYSPSEILGVHVGGRILSIFINEKLDKKAKCYFVQTEQDIYRNTKIKANITRPLSGKILVVEDFFRKGRSIRLVKNHIINYMMPSFVYVKEFRFAVLINASVRREKSYPITSEVDFIAQDSNGDSTIFPWVNFSIATLAAFRADLRENVKTMTPGASGNANKDSEKLNEFARINSEKIKLVHFNLIKDEKYAQKVVSYFKDNWSLGSVSDLQAVVDALFEMISQENKDIKNVMDRVGKDTSSIIIINNKLEEAA